MLGIKVKPVLHLKGSQNKAAKRCLKQILKVNCTPYEVQL